MTMTRTIFPKRRFNANFKLPPAVCFTILTNGLQFLCSAFS